MRRTGTILIGAVAVFAATALVAPAAHAGTGSVIAPEATYDSQSNPTGTHGSDGSINVNSGSSERRAYVKFPVSGIPAGATNIVATLKLWPQATVSGIVTTVSTVPTTWAENTLTWNNHPTPGTVVTTRTGLTGSTYNAYTVSSAVTGNGTYAFVVTSNSTTQRFFNSDDAATGKPTLDLSWTDPTGPAAPVVTTGAASSITSSGATLNGTVNPGNAVTTCHFDYGTSIGYGTSTADQNVGSGGTVVPVSQAITGLTASTPYHFRLVCTNSVAITLGADATFTTGTAGSTNVLDNKTYLKCTEIGEWQIPGTAGSPTAVDPIATSTRNAGFTCIRIAVADCFIGTTCGSPSHAGTISRSDFDLTIQRIRDNLRPTMLWFKLLPTSSDYPSTAIAQSFCPPWTGDASGNLPMYEDQVNEIKTAGWTGPLAIEMSNEMYFACTAGSNGPWDVQSGTNLGGGSVGVSNRVGQHFAATAGPLKTYAQGLGFSQVVVGDDIGVPGGAQWGQTFSACTVGPTCPYGWSWTYSTRWIDEFNNGDKNAGGIVPDFEAWHSYVHSPDNYAAAPYESTLGDPASVTDDDQILYAYVRGQIGKYRTEVNAIWGATAGDAIRFAISEGAAGAANSGGSWSGWTNGTRAPDFYAGWLTALAGDGTLTGTGTRYWEFTDFCDACNTSSPGNNYDVIKPDGTVSNYYATFQNFTP
jgi:hypothetical protein